MACACRRWEGWGGAGWGGALTFKYNTGTPTWCYARDVFTYTCTSTWCNAGDVFTCTCTATWCYARDVFACTCTSTWCYAATLSWHNTQRIFCQVKHSQSQFTSKIRKIHEVKLWRTVLQLDITCGSMMTYIIIYIYLFILYAWFWRQMSKGPLWKCRGSLCSNFKPWNVTHAQP